MSLMDWRPPGLSTLVDEANVKIGSGIFVFFQEMIADGKKKKGVCTF